MKNKLIRLVCIFLILITLIVPTVAETNNEMKKTEQKDVLKGIDFDSPDFNYEKLTDIQKRALKEKSDKWIEDHTFNVTVTTNYKTQIKNSNTNELIVEEIYQSNDPKFNEMFGTNNILSKKTYLIDNKNKLINFEGNMVTLDVYTKESKTEILVVTTGSDPYNWKAVGYPYPDYLWKVVDPNYPGGGLYIRADPVNMMWQNTSASIVKTFILSKTNWTGVITIEYDYRVYDPFTQTYIRSQSVASNPIRPTGGYHVRIYQMPQGYVVAGAHEDSSSPHQAIAFEPVEKYIAGLFSGNSSWSVSNNSTYLNNSCSSPAYNNGYATVIKRQ
ncbi:hypothetical protein [Methanolapillus ohkumae]|uniref:Uncharacterized protein n=1 Tax=Methanolapillus ohkumae TaxID=3028298 RepID=A0AA96ZVB5_9EURY|nr:hypothetical protein MsAm2_04470 [Methanosarcinaceae archaeon Am2]